MVEVFKTNVKYRHQANKVIERIHRNFLNYRANFDLGDCDKILRVENKTGLIKVTHLIELLRDLEVDAEVLPDEDVFAGIEALMNNKKF